MLTWFRLRRLSVVATIVAITLAAAGLATPRSSLAAGCPTASNQSGANLHGQNLSGCNFTSFDLSGANLNGATLTGANLTGAKLNGANLNNADLTGANLSNASAPGVNFQDANLTNANLQCANLQGSNLHGANLTNTNLQCANLKGANLKDATVPAAAITSFSAAPSTITVGSSTTLSAVFTGGTGTVDHSAGAVTSGTPVSVSPTATTTYTLTVTNVIDAKITAQVTVTVVSAPTVTSFTASPTSITAGSSAQLTGVFSGGTGNIDNGVGAVTSGTAFSVSPTATTTYTLTADNGFGGKATKTATVTVTGSPTPVITSFAANPTSITAGGSAQLTGVFSGGTGSIDKSVGPVTSGTAVSVSPTATTTYTLTVDNGAGVTVTKTATVTVTSPAPVITSFAASATSITVGSSTNLTGVFSGGTGSINNGVGAVTSGTAVTVQPTTTTTYTLTVDNGGGGTVTKTATVTVTGAVEGQAISLKPSIGSPAVGQSVTYTATITPSGTTGTVQFGIDIAQAIGNPVSLDTNSSATFTYAFPTQGSHTVYAWYFDTAGTPGVKTFITVTVSSGAAPVITSFVANPTSITAGSTAQLTGVFSGGTGSVDNGVGAVTSNGAKTVNPSVTTTYTLTVDDGAGTTVTSKATVTVTGSAVITSFVADPTSITAGGTAQLTAVFSGVNGSIDNGVGAVTSGTPVTVKPAITTTYTLTVDSGGTSQPIQAQVTVTVTGPVITGFEAKPSSIAVGSATQLTAAFSGGTGSIDNSVGPVTSGVAVSVSPTAKTTYTLTVDGGAAGKVTSQATVTVTAAAPVIASFVANPTSVAVGSTAQLTAVFSGGDGTVDNGGGTVTSGTAVTVKPSGTTTYTLTVDNGSGGKQTAQVTVTVTGNVEGTAVVLALNNNSPVVGQPTTFTATVTPKGATGSVVLGEGGLDIGSAVPLDANSSATLTGTFFTAGIHQPYALYVDAAGTVVAESPLLQVVVEPAPTPTITSFLANPPSIVAGGTTQLTAVFSGGTGSIDSGVGPVTSGTAVSVSPTATTTYTLTVDGGAAGKVTSLATVTLGGLEGQAISVTPDTLTPTVGQPVTFTAVVTPAGATGSVGFGIDSSTNFSITIPLDGSSTATLTQAFTTVGPHQIYVNYIDSGGNHAGKNFTTVNVTAGTGPVISSFAASPATIAAGDTAQLTAVFTGGAGNIDNKVGAVTSGIPATVKPSVTTTYTLTVDDGAGDKVPATVTVTVTQIQGTAISVTPDISSPAVGQTVNFTATVTPPGSTGRVGFGVDSPMFSASIPLDANASASSPVTFTTPGTHTVYVIYIDGTGNPTNVQNSVSITVTGTPVVESFGANPNPISAGVSTQLTAVFEGGTGTIDNGVGPVTSGAAVTVSPTTTTTYTLAVDGGANGTTTAKTTVTVAGVEGTAISLALNPGQTLVVGQPATFTATVTPLGATGSVQMINNIIDTGNPVSLDANSTATITIAPGASGFNTFVAVYIDSMGKFGVSSNQLFLGVDATQPGPSIDSFSANPQPFPPGGTTQLTAFFSNGTGSIDNGVGTVTSGTPVTVTPTGTSTTYTLTVTGPGGTNTATTTVVAGVEGTGISVTPDVGSPTVLQTVNFTATVTPRGATGSVVFFVDTPQILTTVPLDANSSASMPVSFATPGTHTIHVLYIDSAGFEGFPGVTNLATVTWVGGGGGGIVGNAISLTQTGPATAGQPVSFAASVTPTGAAGKAGLSLDAGQSFVDSAQLDGKGNAMLTTTFSTPGTYTVYVYYFDTSGNIAAKNSISVTVS